MKKTGKDTKKELSIKSKLLFNNLDMHFKVVTDLSQKVEKRTKSLNTIFQTYTMTVRPFIQDESKDYVDNVMAKIEEKRVDAISMIEDMTTVEALIFAVSPVMDDMKKMISAFKSGKINEALEIHLNLYPLFKKLFMAPNPVPVKAALAHIGIISEKVRRPLVELDAEEKKELFLSLGLYLKIMGKNVYQLFIYRY